MLAAAWALRPEWFEGGEEYTPDNPMPDDLSWELHEIDLLDLRVHPQYLIEREHMLLVNLWQACQGGFGAGLLPFRGGAAEQPAIVMAGLAVVGAAMRRLNPPKKDAS